MRIIMLRKLVIVALTIGLAGCAAQRQAQLQAQLYAQQAMVDDALEQAYKKETAACETRFSESNKDAIARAKCFNEADKKYVPNARYPDLANLLLAKRTELAEKQAAGKITRAELVLELNQQRTQLVSEEQRRDAVNSAAEAQRNAVAAQQQAQQTAILGQVIQQQAQQQQNLRAVIQPLPTPPTNCLTSYVGNQAYTQCH